MLLLLLLCMDAVFLSFSSVQILRYLLLSLLEPCRNYRKPSDREDAIEPRRDVALPSGRRKNDLSSSETLFSFEDSLGAYTWALLSACLSSSSSCSIHASEETSRDSGRQRDTRDNRGRRSEEQEEKDTGTEEVEEKEDLRNEEEEEKKKEVGGEEEKERKLGDLCEDFLVWVDSTVASGQSTYEKSIVRDVLERKGGLALLHACGRTRLFRHRKRRRRERKTDLEKHHVREDPLSEPSRGEKDEKEEKEPRGGGEEKTEEMRDEKEEFEGKDDIQDEKERQKDPAIIQPEKEEDSCEPSVKEVLQEQHLHQDQKRKKKENDEKRSEKEKEEKTGAATTQVKKGSPNDVSRLESFHH